MMGTANALNLSIPQTITAPAGGTLTTLTSTHGDLSLILQAIDKMGKTNILSSPRIAALNGEEARLAVATKQPYVSQTVVQTTSSTDTADNVQFVDVGVTLKVQPRILSDGLIEMKIRPQVSSSTSNLELQGVATGSNTLFTRTKIPIVTTQELETTVTVKSGSTIIVGGLIQDTMDKQSQRLPVLGGIPLAGQLFNSKTNDFSKTELVVFLTPTVMDTELVAGFDKQKDRFFEKNGEIKEHAAAGGYQAPGEFKNGLFESRQIPYWQKDIQPGKSEVK